MTRRPDRGHFEYHSKGAFTCHLKASALALCAGALLTSPSPARAGAPWASVGVLAGATRFDDHLADYQWNVEPRSEWGVQALGGMGRLGSRLGGGVRVTQATTTQRIDLANESNPTVRVTTFELIGRGRLAAVAGVSLEPYATAGRQHLGYAPDHVSIAPSGGGPNIEVTLEPIDSWTAGGGVGLRHALAGPFTAAIEIGARSFAMDTAHRNGSTIETRRERFSEWSARFELARSYGRR